MYDIIVKRGGTVYFEKIIKKKMKMKKFYFLFFLYSRILIIEIESKYTYEVNQEINQFFSLYPLYFKKSKF
jgi:hypothetical protein